MSKRRKTVDELFYDQFTALPLIEQKQALGIMTELYRQALRYADGRRQPKQAEIPGLAGSIQNTGGQENGK